MECLHTVDLQTLRDACKANGLPTSGTKRDCFHRLQSGVGDGPARRNPLLVPPMVWARFMAAVQLFGRAGGPETRNQFHDSLSIHKSLQLLRTQQIYVV